MNWSRRKRVGLALGSGGARGWAHLGVLRALREKNITVEYIAGTSMGSVVGACGGPARGSAAGAGEQSGLAAAAEFLLGNLSRSGLTVRLLIETQKCWA